MKNYIKMSVAVVFAIVMFTGCASNSPFGGSSYQDSDLGDIRYR